MITERAVCPDTEALYLEYRGRVRAYALHHLQNVQDAEDAVSQVFLNAYKNRGAYDPKKGLYSTWLYAITRNVVREAQRRTGRSRTDGYFDEWETLECQDPRPEDALLTQERVEALADALEKLPERERDILLLRFYSGLSSREVAARMGLSDGNVRYLQSRAISRLRGLLEP
jgi:RNA polymerase sigma-70 factor (ECF subfamily)